MRFDDLFPNFSHPSEPRDPGVSGGIVLLAYLLAVLIGVVAHEPWFDEAQSWLLARDASPSELLGQYLRYEGHPPLWYFLLMPAAKLGLPYGTANVISVLCSALGVWLFLRLPGIPFLVRCLLPFGFYVAYQFSVVARSYALVFPLLMLVLHLYPHRRERVVSFAVVLVLLSQVSLHGLALAWAFAGLYVLELVSSRRRLVGSERRRHGIAGTLLVASTAALVWILLPSDDLLIADQIGWAEYPARLMRKAPLISTGLAGAGILSVLLWLGSLVWFWRHRTLAVYLATTAAVWSVAGIYANYWHEGLFYLVWTFSALLTFQRSAGSFEAWGSARVAALAMVILVLGTNAEWGLRSLGKEVSSAYSASGETARYLEMSGLSDRKVFAFG
ncbi:MAG: hypothetical protein MI919_06440, partial [Holophagales bacterium]|nr:hypothetical protein [Holophagales bacterium]